MLGAEETALLESFAASGVDQETWDAFIASIGARVEGKSMVQDDAIYSLYVLEKQDKRLLLLDRCADGLNLEVRYQFGTQEEILIPRMQTVVLMYET